jgi:tetratricopeptide (TPR) repeat protein
MRSTVTAPERRMRAGRNDPCPCGSGRRFKHCCGRVSAPAAAVPTAAPDVNEIGGLVGLVNQGAAAQAEARSLQLLQEHPEFGILWKILSVALVRQGKDALPALRRAAELMPQDPEAHANLGSELHARGQWEAALESLRRSLALERRNANALAEAGDAQRALGHPREAVELYGWALELDPRRRDVHNNLGNAHLALGAPAEAARAYRRALELKEDDAQVLCNLGNALRQLAEFDEALAVTRRALALAPRLAMAHNNLGLLLSATGQREAGAASYREALRLNPAYPEAARNLARVLRDQGQLREAVALYGQALQLDPSQSDAHCDLGYALFDARRLSEAAASFRQALALRPGSVSALLGLAAVLRVQGAYDEAEASCQAGLAAEPRNAAALEMLGELRADAGRFAEAQELFQRAIDVDPDFVPAYGSIAAHRRMQREDRGWLAGVQRLLGRSLPVAEEMHLRYALGKYFDEVGEYDHAFASYQAANELARRHGPSYDRGRFAALVDRVMSVCDERFVGAQHAQVSASELPVFIIGMPRSGTSLTEQILASHPAVFGAGEVRFWDGAFVMLERRGASGAGVGETLGDIGRECLERLTARAGEVRRVTDKMPANFLYAGLIHAALPRARIIHMQRHPLDTCLSVYFQNFFNVSPYANELGNLAHYYGEYLRLCARWRRLLPASTLLEVPYEGLIADTEGWTRRMLDFIGLEFDARCLEFHRTERVVITASKWQVRQQISAGSIGRWRRYEKHLAPLMALLDATPGYRDAG